MLYLKTDAGRAELQARTRPLTPSQRQVLILCDGERRYDDLLAMIPEATLEPAIGQLVEWNLLAARPQEVPVPRRAAAMTDAERFRTMVELATSMASDLGLAGRVKAQLQIEKAASVQDLTGVVDLLWRNLAEQGKKTPQLARRLDKLRELAGQA